METGDDLEELSTARCMELLRTVTVGRLGVPLPDGGVDIFPVNFVVDHGTVVFRTAPGTKLDAVRDAPAVAFEADDWNWYDRIAWSVVVKGAATAVERPEDVFELFDVELQPWHASRKPVFVRVVPTSTTGRRFTVASSAMS